MGSMHMDEERQELAAFMQILGGANVQPHNMQRRLAKRMTTLQSTSQVNSSTALPASTPLQALSQDMPMSSPAVQLPTIAAAQNSTHPTNPTALLLQLQQLPHLLQLLQRHSACS